ncbi:MAG: ABC transporter permease [Candidatus Saccharimonadales bacterium]
MYLKDLLRRAARSLLSAKIRTLLTAFAIAVGTFALTLTLGASNGAQSYVNKIINDNFDPTELIVTKDNSLFGRADTSTPQEYDPSFGSAITAGGDSTQIKRLNDTDLATLKSIPGVEQVRTATSVNAKYITRPGQRKYVSTLQTYTASQNPELLAGSIASLPAGSVILPEGFLNVLGFSSPQQALHQKVTVVVQKQADISSLQAAFSKSSSTINIDSTTPTAGDKEVELTIVAVSKKPTTIINTTALYLYANQQDTLQLSDFITQGTANFHQYITANVRVQNGNNKAHLVSVQKKIKNLGYSAQSVQDTQKFLTQIISVLQGIVTAFGFIAVVASLFGIVNTMYISVLQRTREIGLMKALGMRKKDITKLFRFEAALIGFLGGLIGAVTAVVLGTLLNPFITQKLSLGKQHLLIFKFNQIVVLIIILIFVATFAGLLPARKASRLDPIEALRTE